VNLTPHFTLEELTTTNKALDNTPSKEMIEVLRTTAFHMERVRELLGNVSIKVSSGYRSPEVNKAVGGSKTSAHLLGYAVDFTAYGHTPLTIANTLAKSDLKFDQLIYEGTWVHISFDPKMRREVLTARFKNGKATYLKGIV
jgi:putative chitinase